MKIFLLTVTILFLISRIKNTPRMLSKKLYFSTVKKSIERDKRVSKGGDRILEKVSRSEARTKAVGKSNM